MPPTESNSTLCVLGRIEEIPEGSLTEKDLLERGEDNVAPIIRVIENNQLHLIPKEILSDKVLSEYDIEYRTAYYVAAINRSFKEIPKELINEEVLTTINSIGYEPRMVTLWAVLLSTKEIEPLLPFIDSLINDTSGEERTPFLHLVAKNGLLDKIPKHYITKERVFTKALKGENLIQMAAIGGNLNQIPKEFLTSESIQVLNSNKETPIHLAAKHGTLNLVPKEFLTKEYLQLRDEMGTVFHKAAKHNCIDQIPKEFLTKEFLKQKSNHSHQNCFHLVAQHSDFKNFPDHLLIEENFIEANNGLPTQKAPAHYLCDTYNKAAAYEYESLKDIETALKKLLSRVSIESLRGIKKYVEYYTLERAYPLIQKELLKKEVKSELEEEMSLGI